jgi:hypothetical protein
MIIELIVCVRMKGFGEYLDLTDGEKTRRGGENYTGTFKSCKPLSSTIVTV